LFSAQTISWSGTSSSRWLIGDFVEDQQVILVELGEDASFGFSWTSSLP
jgi:hypothetical protein